MGSGQSNRDHPTFGESGIKAQTPDTFYCEDSEIKPRQELK